MDQINDIGELPKKKDIKMLTKAKWCLLGCLIVVVILVICSVFLPGELTNVVRWLGDNSIASGMRSLGGQQDINKDNLVEMVVETVGVTRATSQPVVLLKQKNGERYLPVWIGLVEVNAISVVLEGVEMPRPLTPDLLCDIVDKLGGNVEHVVITELKDSIFYARVVLHTNWVRIAVDSRPSDAIAIAIRVKAPIYVTQEVLDKAGVTPDNKTEKQNTVYHRKLTPQLFSLI